MKEPYPFTKDQEAAALLIASFIIATLVVIPSLLIMAKAGSLM